MLDLLFDRDLEAANNISKFKSIHQNDWILASLRSLYNGGFGIVTCCNDCASREWLQTATKFSDFTPANSV